MNNRVSDELKRLADGHSRVTPIFRKTGSVVEGVDAFTRDRETERVMDALPAFVDLVRRCELQRRDGYTLASCKRTSAALAQLQERFDV